MTSADQLRKLAKDLREASKKLEEEKTQKCAQILVAAQGLDALRRRRAGEVGK
jgi:hypothetical protein